jgi:hypothetical protein
MPKAVDWINFIYVNLGFIAQIVAMYFYSSLSDIKSNWPKYRCNPIFMPLSDNIEQDFVYCVQNMQTNFMGYLLEPLTYITSNLTSLGSGFTDSLNFIRVMISNIRTFLLTIAESIMSVFLNLIIEFQKITIGIRDLVNKLIGVMVVLMYVMDGSIKTMQSVWNGPPGQMVKSLAGNCFHPNTMVKLKNGNLTKMKDLNLGDCIENGSIVNIVMKIQKTKTDKFYKFNNGADGNEILVTGSHMIQYKSWYITVEEHPEAMECQNMDTDYLSCIITSDHLIKLGDFTFYDWDDDEIRENYYKRKFCNY